MSEAVENEKTRLKAKQAQADVVEAMHGDDLDEHDIIHVGEFVKVLKMVRGNELTPVEWFITNLPWLFLMYQERGQGMTPDDIVRELDQETRGYFEDGVKITRIFQERYPLAVQGAANA